MSERDEPIGQVQEALQFFRGMQLQGPGDWMINSIVAQIEYVLACLQGRESDLSRIGKLTLGVYGAKEFDYQEAAPIQERLFAVSTIADELARNQGRQQDG